MPVRLWRKPLDAETIEVPKAEVHILKDRCKGCGYCIEFCPRGVLEVSEEFNQKGVHFPKVKDETQCALCGFCEAVCPDFAIYATEKDCSEGS